VNGQVYKKHKMSQNPNQNIETLNSALASFGGPLLHQAVSG